MFASEPRAHHCLCTSVVAALLPFAACVGESRAADTAPLASISEAPDATGSEGVEAREDSPSQLGGPLPGGAYFSDVMAIGTGCPAGTWEVSLAPDGRTFTATFAGFETEVDRSHTVAIRNCTLSIRLHSSAGFSFTIDDLQIAGYMVLDPGVEARLVTRYWFLGAGGDEASFVSDWTGPVDQSFLLQVSGEDFNAVPSPCAAEQTLSIALGMRLHNTSGGSGYLAIQQFPARPLKLRIRPCSP